MNDPEQVKISYPSVFESSAWETTEYYFEKIGVLAALIGGSVLPIHPFLLVGAFSDVNNISLVLSLTIVYLTVKLFYRDGLLETFLFAS